MRLVSALRASSTVWTSGCLHGHGSGPARANGTIDATLLGTAASAEYDSRIEASAKSSSLSRHCAVIQERIGGKLNGRRTVVSFTDSGAIADVFASKCRFDRRTDVFTDFATIDSYDDFSGCVNLLSVDCDTELSTPLTSTSAALPTSISIASWTPASTTMRISVPTLFLLSLRYCRSVRRFLHRWPRQQPRQE